MRGRSGYSAWKVRGSVNSDNFILQIKASYNQFTKAEKKVADYVIANQSGVLYMSITDLADACRVGDTSVYRFCRTMKLQGYQEFKMKMSLSQAAAAPAKPSPQAPYDNLGSMAEKIMELHMEAIKETYMLLDRDNFEKTLDMFEKAERVHFFGIGDSLLTAEEARNKFLRVTNKVSCITPYAVHGGLPLRQGRFDCDYFLFRGDQGQYPCSQGGKGVRRPHCLYYPF